MGTHIVNVQDGLRKIRYDRFGTEIGQWDWQNKPYPEVIQAARDAFEKGEGCAVKGRLLVNWVPGNFHIASHDYNQILSEIGQMPNLTHSILELNFAYKYSVENIWEKFGY